MENKIICYIIQNYDGIKIFETLQEAVDDLKSNGVLAMSCLKDSPIEVVYKNKDRVQVDLQDFIVSSKIDANDILAIELEIEKKIVEQKKEFSEGMQIAIKTGGFPYNKRDKKSLILREIEHRSYIWK